MLQVCANIKQARVSAGKTQEEMAGYLEVKRTTYANWEKDTEPSLTILMSISRILGIELGEIINSDISKVTKKEEIIALRAAVQVLVLELIQLRSKVNKESPTLVSLDLQKMMQQLTAQLINEAS